jgi:hypothetical protein
MPDARDHFDEVASLAESLTGLGLEPILVGGMAMVIIGSRRVTRDFDFVIPQPGERLEQLVTIFYGRGLELAARVSRAGDVTATIDNPRVATTRLRLDAPASAYFLNPETGLRIDLLFDFPVPAAELAKNATRTKIRSRALRVASEDDLLRLKKIAGVQRSAPGDAEDVAFLEARRRRKPKRRGV